MAAKDPRVVELMEDGMDEEDAIMAIQMSTEDGGLNDDILKPLDCDIPMDEEQQQLQRAIEMSKEDDVDYTQDEIKHDTDEITGLLSDIS